MRRGRSRASRGSLCSFAGYWALSHSLQRRDIPSTAPFLPPPARYLILSVPPHLFALVSKFWCTRLVGASCRDMYGTPDRHTLLESPGSGSTAHTWASVFVTPRKHRHNNVAALPPAHATPAPPTTQSAARRYCRARRLVAASSGAVWGLASPALLILGGGWEWLALARLAWAVGMLLLNNPHIWTPLRGLRCALLVRLLAWSVLAPAIGVVLFYDPVLPPLLPLSLLLLLMLLEGATAPPPAISDGHFLERQLQVPALQVNNLSPCTRPPQP